MNLEDIGRKYNTDKVGHKFLPRYEERFGHRRHDKLTILEIGTWDGRSLRMWQEFFDQSKIVGMDINPEWIPDDDDPIKFVKGNQTNKDDMDRVAAHGPFDIIVDDGGHLPNEHIISFRHLWPYVNPDGWYAIEDCFSLFNTCWTQPTDRTIIDVFKEELVKPLMIGEGDICEVHFVGDGMNDGLIFFHKRG